MDSELLLKFIGYFPDYLLPLSHMLLHFFWTTFVETAVYEENEEKDKGGKEELMRMVNVLKPVKPV